MNNPGEDTLVPYPAATKKPVEFGLTGGTMEEGTDHATCGGLKDLGAEKKDKKEKKCVDKPCSMCLTTLANPTILQTSPSMPISSRISRHGWQRLPRKVLNLLILQATSKSSRNSSVPLLSPWASWSRQI